MNTIKNWLEPPIFAEPEKTRTAYYLNYLLLSVMILIAALVIIQALAGINSLQSGLAIIMGLFWLVMLGLQVGIRKGYVKQASYIFILSGWLAVNVQAWNATGVHDTAFVANILVILIAGLLLGWRTAALFAALSITYGWFMAYAEANGILTYELSSAYNLAIDTTVIFTLVAIILGITIGSLQNAVKRATASEQSVARSNEELQAIQDQLEMRVAEQTRDLALAAEIGRNVAQTRDVDELLKSSVERIRSRFDLYYAQIYLTNDYKTGLELTAATGSVGEYLLAQGHRLAIDAKSINSLAALEKRPVIVSDTAQSLLFKPNPSLPYTRSEMAIPLLAGQNVLGVLDLQATNTGALSEDNLPAFEALAGQIAIALENASLFREQARLTDALKENTEREAENARFLDSVIENLPVMLFVKDAENLRFLRWNKAGSDLIGLPAEAFIGKTDYDLFPEHEAEFFIRKDREVLNNGMRVDIPEEPIQTIDKGTRLLHTVKVPILDAAGKAQYLLGVSQDITEQKEAESMLGERVKELNLLNEIGRKTDDQPTVPEFLTFIATHIPAGMQYSDLCRAAVMLEGVIYGDVQAVDLPCHIVEGLRLDDELVGRVYIAYTENRVFLNEESALIGDIGRRITNYIVNQRLLSRVQHSVEGLQTVAEVGAAITATMNPKQLLQSIVDLTKSKFGFYHAHIYLYEESSNTLVLAAGAGEIGQQMVAESRQIPLSAPRSLVARSAREQKALVVGDVQAEPGFLAHPLLPETQSELAVPLAVGGLLLGVLDIQSSEKNGFSAEDVNVQMTLASQIAVALQNAGQYQQTQDALEEVSALQRALTREGWQAFITAVDRPIQGFSASREGIQPIMAAERPPTNGHQDDNSFVYPISVQGTAIGHLGFKTSEKELTAGDLALVESITAQVAEALERARLFEQTESARSQTEALFSGSEQVVRAATPDDVLQAVVQSTSLHEYERASLHLFNRPWQSVQPESMVLAAFWRRDGQPSILPVGVSMPLAQYPIVQHLQREEPLVFKDMSTDPRVDENTRSLFIDVLGMRSVLAVPLVAGDQWIGFVLGYSAEPHHLLESNLRQITSLAGQAATVIQSQQLYQQARTRAEREQMLREITARVRSSADIDTIMKTAVQEIGRALGKKTYIYIESGKLKSPKDTSPLEEPGA